MSRDKPPRKTLQQASILASSLLLLMTSVSSACYFTVKVPLTGSGISDVPRNLSSDIRYLWIHHTNISILNLTAAGHYPMMCYLRVISSPVRTLITPDRPQTASMTAFWMETGQFPTPPNLGNVLEEQLKYLTFKGIDIVTIPDNYFENYPSLNSLSLTNNPISDLNAGNMAGLRNLQNLYLVNTHVSSLGGLHQWLPILKGLFAADSYVETLPASIWIYHGTN